MTTAAIAYDKHVPEVYKGFIEAHGRITKSGLENRLRHLIELRASQINQCAFCVKMHVAEAKKDGETAERLERLMVWRRVDDFTDAEKAVLAWTEALTVLDVNTDYHLLRENLRNHFSDGEISSITSAIAMINLWNRMQVSQH